jgi:hypothetical protein
MTDSGIATSTPPVAKIDTVSKEMSQRTLLKYTQSF